MNIAVRWDLIATREGSHMPVEGPVAMLALQALVYRRLRQAEAFGFPCRDLHVIDEQNGIALRLRRGA